MEVLIRYAAVALLLAGSACDFVRPPTVVDPPRDQLLVHSVLSAGTDTVRVLLTRPASDQSFDAAPVRVSGAQVRIAGGGAEVLLREAPEGFGHCLIPRYNGDPSPPAAVAGPGCYAAVLPGGVLAGTRYTLEVHVPGGERASGETTVPARPEWIRPAEGERIHMRWSTLGGLHMGEVESLALQWRSAAAALEIPIVAADEVYAGGQIVEAGCVLYLLNPDGSLAMYSGASVQGDSLRVRAHLANCTQRGAAAGSASPVRPDSVSVSLLLAAYDTAYVVHTNRRGERGIREDRASPGLRGAYGVFGSVATALRRIMFVIEES